MKNTVVSETKKSRGGQAGNQNARKHGFYSPELDEEEKHDLKYAVEVEGIDQEIALLRVKLKSVMRNDPDNVKLMILAVESIARLLRAKYNIGKNDRKGLKEAVGNVLRDVALPLGVGIGIGRNFIVK